MATYNKNTNWDNERKYLSNLAKNGTEGQKAWAQNQQRVLERAYSAYNPSRASTSTASGGVSGSSGAARPGGSTASRPSTGSTSSTVSKPTTTTNPGIDISIFDNNIMSADDLRKVNEYKQLYADAVKAGNQQLADSYHNYVEAIRRQYGYSGGTAGDQFIDLGYLMPEMPEMPEYVSGYEDTINSLVNSIMNTSFEDWANGSDYQYLMDKYKSEGQKAMLDTLGSLASRSGGYASSYATAAANQSYNDYMGLLQDAARAMYTDDLNKQIQSLGIVNDLETQNYNRYLDALNQYNTDRNFAYNQYLDNRNWDYTLQQDADADALRRAETMAALGDFSGYRDLGYTDAQIGMMQAAYNQQMAPSYSGYSGGGGGAASSDGMDYEGLFAAAQASGNPKSWLAQKANYQKYGFTSSSGLYDDYLRWEEGSGSDTGSSSTLSGFWDAVKGGLSSGISNGINSYIGSMSSAAQNLYGQISSIDKNNPAAVSRFAEQIEKALNNGSITDSEASRIISAFGY